MKIKKATLLNIDCMEYMKGLPDKFFDLAVCDPPYGIGNWVQVTGNVYGNSKEVTWNDQIPSNEYFNELKRVSKERIVWGANYYNSFNESGGAIVWWKRIKPETNLSECEIASYSRLKRVAFVDLVWQNVNRGESTIHPCQKPVKLYEWLLTNYAKPGQKILDTHGGSMSSVIAANNLGFEIVCCELDQDYYKAACERVAKHAQQERLF